MTNAPAGAAQRPVIKEFIRGNASGHVTYQAKKSGQARPWQR